jgi:hypothetical protein
MQTCHGGVCVRNELTYWKRILRDQGWTIEELKSWRCVLGTVTIDVGERISGSCQEL